MECLVNGDGVKLKHACWETEPSKLESTHGPEIVVMLRGNSAVFLNGFGGMAWKNRRRHAAEGTQCFWHPAQGQSLLGIHLPSSVSMSTFLVHTVSGSSALSASEVALS